MLLAVLIQLSCSTKTETATETKPNIFSNEASKDQMLLVLSAPSVHNNYYKPAFEKIVDFQINYAKKILGNDNVVVIVDKDTKRFYEGKLPEDILIMAEVFDIWMRDFTTVNPLDPTQFQYTWASMSKKQAQVGQYLVILPRQKIVAVRLVKPSRNYNPQTDWFADFPSLIQNLVK